MLLLPCLGGKWTDCLLQGLSTPKGREARLRVHLMPHFLQPEWLNGMSAMLLFFNSFRGKEKDFILSPKAFSLILVLLMILAKDSITS